MLLFVSSLLALLIGMSADAVSVVFASVSVSKGAETALSSNAIDESMETYSNVNPDVNDESALTFTFDKQYRLGILEIIVYSVDRAQTYAPTKIVPYKSKVESGSCIIYPLTTTYNAGYAMGYEAYCMGHLADSLVITKSGSKSMRMIELRGAEQDSSLFRVVTPDTGHVISPGTVDQAITNMLDNSLSSYSCAHHVNSKIAVSVKLCSNQHVKQITFLQESTGTGPQIIACNIDRISNGDLIQAGSLDYVPRTDGGLSSTVSVDREIGWVTFLRDGTEYFRIRDLQIMIEKPAGDLIGVGMMSIGESVTLNCVWPTVDLRIQYIAWYRGTGEVITTNAEYTLHSTVPTQLCSMQVNSKLVVKQPVHSEVYRCVFYVGSTNVGTDVSLEFVDLGIYKNLAEGSTGTPSDSMTALKDLTLSTCTEFDQASDAEFLLTFATVTEDNTDSYGLNKVILYSDTNTNLAGWKVQFYSLEQSNWVYCAETATEAPTDTTITNVTIACVPNARTKKIKLVPPSSAGKLCEVVAVGDASYKYACDIGWSSDSGKQPCDPCPSGKFGSEANVCTHCSGGTYSKYEAFDPLLECPICYNGYFSEEGAAECTACPKGKIAATDSASECTDCPQGGHQDDEGKNACKECGPGTYADAEGLADCLDCKVGTYIAGNNGKVCLDCAIGYFQALTKQTECTKCEAGKYAAIKGSENCTPCAAGTISAGEGAYDCDKCQIGKYQDITGKTSCIDCKVGTFAADVGAISCTSCPKGQFAATAGSTSCTDCPKGKFMGQVGSTTCAICPDNHYQDTVGQSECKKCEAGSASASGAESCFSCLKGTFLDSEVMECKNCPAGTYTDTEGATSCTMTDVNQYQDEEKAQTFKQCAAGTIAATKGASKCVYCDRGYHRPDFVQEPTCLVCTAGTFAENKGSALCENCPVGRFSVKGAIECKVCAVGEYQDQEGQDTCKKCAPGTFSDTPGSSACVACPADTYSNEQGSFTCISCTYGYYQPYLGNTSCITCPTRAAYQPASCPPVIPNCPSLSYTNQYGDFEWPEQDPPDDIKDAVDVFKPCGFALYDDIGPLEKGKVSRKCITWKEGNEQKSNWTDASYATCGTAESAKIYEVQQQLKAAQKKAEEEGGEVELSPEVSQSILTSLTDATKGKDIGAADSANVVAALSVVSNSVDLTNKENQNNMLDAINSFADQDPAFISDSGGDTTAQAVNVVENIGAGILAAAAASSGSGAAPEPVKTKTMTIASTPVNEKSKTEVTALSFGEDEEDEEEEVEPTEPIKEVTEPPEAIIPEEDEFVPATEDPLEKAKRIAEEKKKPKVVKQPKKIVNIAMPPLGNLLVKGEDGKEPAGLICVVFKSANLFPTNKTEDSTPGQPAEEKVIETVASNVVLLALGDKPVMNIDPPLKLNFTKEEPTDVDMTTKTVNYKCVYYIPETKTWSSEGCITLAANKSFGGQVQCSCDHMTSFAILMSVEPIPDNLAKIQSLITNPLIGLSLISLCLMVGMILPIKQLRSTRSMKIHLSLAGSQIFAIAVFLCTNFITPSSPAPLCPILAVMLHYAYLVVFMWTIVESVIMYISLVQVFGGHISKYMLKFNLFCWSVPILSPVTSYFLTDTDLLMDDKCVVKPSISKYSFILPIGVVLLINTYIFFTLLKVILKAKSPDKSATANAMKQLKAVASISCLLGLGWMVAFFGFGALAPYCQFAFIILNGGQGVLMFIFYCLLNDQFIDEWRAKFGLPPRIPQNKATSSGAGATKATVAQGASSVAPVAQAAPKPTPAAAAPKPAPAAVNRDPKSDDSWIKNEPEDVVYENNAADNIYDTLDDPDIGSMNPATITRI